MSGLKKEIVMEWLFAGLTLLIGLIVAFILVAIIRKVLRKTKLEPLLQSFIVSAARVVLIFMAVMIAIEKVGVSPSSFVTVMGVTGAAIALAVKDTLANVAGGIMIIASHPFKAGDYIVMDGHGGHVEKINILRTVLKTLDGNELVIPNSLISTSVLTNYTKKDYRRVDMCIRVNPEEDVRKVEELLMNVAAACPLIVEEPAPSFGVRGVEEGNLALDFFAWCKSTEYWDAFYMMQETVNMALEEAGIRRHASQMEVQVIK